ncbi:DNA polymerase IV (DinB-like DNA polymerase) [Halovenus aranensis]|jgi:DNA polymerase IV (DinB-like DNA polymerase)|uniref:DNA polymerase IV n=1 Tax=Halovenus aranensis TaxID=890420 RepID=A0A1G8V6R2_9EURY|nr:DNA polymerase IV [Halovenus aranensis]SDJ61733.1 DNA polymerase IV (DinB-like DNA polymerase) [Halovenus aranensis]
MGRPSRLPGTDVDDQLVCHVDIDCFYAACERLREPALRGQPVIVGMGYEPGEDIGAVATASYEAREYGVESAQAISTALDRLPRKREAARRDDLDVSEAAFYRPVDMEYYESVAADIKEILHERATIVREVSIDEAYLDVTDAADWSTVETFATELKDEIATAVGVTASVGVAPTMSAAKVASDHDKPDGLVVVRPGEVADFFAPLDIESVHGVGPVTADRLRAEGIETAGDLADADPSALEDWFGERGRRIYRFSRGEDDRSVEPRGQPKSLSRESAFAEATADPERQHDRLQSLAGAVARRARSRDVLYQTISIKVVTPPYDIQTRAQSLPGPVADERLVEEVALELFEDFRGSDVRKLGVRVANLSFTGESQSKLGEWADESDGDSNVSTRPEHRRSGQRTLTDFE